MRYVFDIVHRIIEIYKYFFNQQLCLFVCCLLLELARVVLEARYTSLKGSF
ncbi:hypothetical protein Fmac_021791 [Flemingia macrophylla]|uniref:Uncharacterized protein n=1 Tax=Flemingia macrophylla TaxID=520843 RepID=A0ABD1LXU9_9FABA